jgi:hypothetical protein
VDGEMLRALGGAAVSPSAADGLGDDVAALPAPADEAPETLLPPPSGAATAGLAAAAVLLLWSQASRGFLSRIVDGANLVFHEAGHPIFGLFGSRFLMYLGGTLGQLAFPVAAAILFARRRQTGSLLAAVLWIGVNLVNIGIYAADAEVRVLPLLAPDIDSHDWWNMLGTLGVRHHATAIGGFFKALGWTAQVAAPTWAAWRWWAARSARSAAEPG